MKERIKGNPFCPSCGTIVDGATALEDNDERVTGVDDDKRPSAGDFSVCAYCAHVSLFDGDLQLRTYTGESPERVLHAQALVRLIIRDRPEVPPLRNIADRN